MFKAGRASASPAATVARRQDNRWSGARVTTEEERFLRNPTREPPESHGYPCRSRNRGINLPTVINRKAQAAGERRWKFPSIVSVSKPAGLVG